MNENKIIDHIENKKEKLNINELYDDVVEIVEKLENKDHEKFQAYFKTFNKSNSFIINKYHENDVVEFIEKNYDVELIKHDKFYELNNKNIFDVEIEIIDPIFKNIQFIDNYKLSEIFDDEIDNITNSFSTNISDIKQLIHDEINKIYYYDDQQYLNHYCIKYQINSYDILKLFENIVDVVKYYNDEIDDPEIYDEFDDEFHHEKIDVDDLKLLFENVVDELNKIDDLNKYLSFFNSNRKFKINIEYMPYLYNNKYNYYDDEILYNMLENELYEIDDNYILKNIFMPEIYIDINENLFLEYCYINNLINNNHEFKYNIEIDDKYNYIDYSIEISIDDILKLNEKIENIHELKYDPFKIYELFENFNNNHDDDEFIYLLFENEYQYLYDDEIFYKNCYYELNDEKFHDIFELKKYMLNIMKHYNLNNSFKFDDEIFHA